MHGRIGPPDSLPSQSMLRCAMGLTAGCVLWEGELRVGEIVSVLANVVHRTGCGESEALVCPPSPSTASPMSDPSSGSSRC